MSFRAILGRSLFLASTSLLVAGSAMAASITYQVNNTIGTGSVTGTITTDGNFGALAGSDFSGWNLNLSDGTHTYSLVSGNNSVVFVLGNDVSADAQHLYFNYSGSDTGVFAFQQNLFSGAHYYCNATPSASFYCATGTSVVPTDVFSNPGFPRVALTGKQIVASVPVVSNVPEPATVSLLALGIAGIVWRKRRNVA